MVQHTNSNIQGTIAFFFVSPIRDGGRAFTKHVHTLFCNYEADATFVELNDRKTKTLLCLLAMYFFFEHNVGYLFSTMCKK